MSVGLVILGAVLLLVGGLALVASQKPDAFVFSRSTSIAADPASIYALIQDFHAWKEWSPWENLDPSLERSYGGSAAGVGANYAWKGNKKVGKGRMEITDSVANSKVIIDLHFMEPFEARNITTFELSPQGSNTALRWSMSGKHNLIMKVMGLFMSMDALIGKDFESGLASIKRLAEAKRLAS